MKCAFLMLKKKCQNRAITHKPLRQPTIMKEKRLRSLKVKVIQVFSKWQEPHETTSYKESGVLQSMEVSDEGEIRFTISPKHPHCPCCLLNASQLREKLLSLKDVKSVYCEVVGIPGKERWVRSINS